MRKKKYKHDEQKMMKIVYDVNKNELIKTKRKVFILFGRGAKKILR
jgi:hypothetical protein